jgi:hypothetical protein
MQVKAKAKNVENEELKPDATEEEKEEQLKLKAAAEDTLVELHHFVPVTRLHQQKYAENGSILERLH